MDESTFKTCFGCSEALPLEQFHRSAASRDGRKPRCKSCVSAWHKTHYAANRERLTADHRAWYDANREARRVSQRAWYQANAESQYAAHRARVEANPERQAELQRQWRANNPERDRELSRAWRAANRERLRELGREAYRKNPEKFILRSHERRAILANVPVGQVDLDALWTGLCPLCGGRLDRDVPYPDPLSKSLDHIVPLSQGGPHQQDNLQWTHLYCNVSKGARLD